jgi:hypothetical protein
VFVVCGVGSGLFDELTSRSEDSCSVCVIYIYIYIYIYYIYISLNNGAARAPVGLLRHRRNEMEQEVEEHI